MCGHSHNFRLHLRLTKSHTVNQREVKISLSSSSQLDLKLSKNKGYVLILLDTHFSPANLTLVEAHWIWYENIDCPLTSPCRYTHTHLRKLSHCLCNSDGRPNYTLLPLSCSNPHPTFLEVLLNVNLHRNSSLHSPQLLSSESHLFPSSSHAATVQSCLSSPMAFLTPYLAT